MEPGNEVAQPSERNSVVFVEKISDAWVVSRVVPCHVLITFFLHRGGFQTLTEQILSLLFVSQLHAISSVSYSVRNLPPMTSCHASPALNWREDVELLRIVIS